MTEQQTLQKISGARVGTAEKDAWKINGFLGIFLFVVLMAACIWMFIQFVVNESMIMLVLSVVCLLVGSLLMCGLTIVQPNKAAVVTFFGRYIGVIRENGMWLTVPLSTNKKVSLRVSNFNSEKLKVNDINGNPIEIAAVVVFRVVDAAKAMLDVNNYQQFVEIQSETSLRHVAAQYPYDNFDEDRMSLRSNGDEVSRQLAEELQGRLSLAGVEILEARLTHLAYATEIASAMLQRQQANAILAARQIIVDGAVGMAQMAIANLEKDGTLELDDERKLNMINNLMVSIITDRSSQPVINVGSMY